MVDRRRFLSSGVALGAAAAFNRQLFAKVDAAPRNLPSSALYSSDEDSYWAEIRKQFLIPEDEVFLNNATVGSSPAPVLRAVFDAYNEIEKLAPEDPEDYPMWGYGSRPFNQFRDPMAAFVGCSRDEIALVRSATEGINYFANGVDMKPGDEVLITDQEHEHGEQPWQLKARRYGIAVKKVRLPKPAEDAAQVLNLFNDAITSRTRVMFFSHITTETGVVLPVKELCGLAHAKGILSAVDGAQVMGMMRVNVRDLGCDVYCASGHKWLQGPKGTGFFYVRDEVIDRLWNTFACQGWSDQTARPTFSAIRYVKCAVSLGPDGGNTVCQSDRARPHRTPSPSACRLCFGRDGEAGRRFVDLAGSSAALRYRNRECSSNSAHGY